MSIRINCECGKSFDVPDAAAGKSGRCKACRAAFTVPIEISDGTWPSVSKNVEWLPEEPPEPPPVVVDHFAGMVEITDSSEEIPAVKEMPVVEEKAAIKPPVAMEFVKESPAEKNRFTLTTFAGFLRVLGYLQLIAGMIAVAMGGIMPGIGLMLASVFPFIGAALLVLLIEMADSLASISKHAGRPTGKN